MSHKHHKGYFYRGHFITIGSDADLALRQEQNKTEAPSKTTLKKQSSQLQQLGQQLLTLGNTQLKELQLPEQLLEAIAAAKKITNFEGKRRQLQFIGKLMRQLDAATIATIEQTIAGIKAGLAITNDCHHLAEQWRDNLINDNQYMSQWVAQYPDSDIQNLNRLIRQARKEQAAAEDTPAPPKKAYRELFKLLYAQISNTTKS